MVLQNPPTWLCVLFHVRNHLFLINARPHTPKPFHTVWVFLTPPLHDVLFFIVSSCMRTRLSSPQPTPRESDLEQDQATLLTQNRIVSAAEPPAQVAEGSVMLIGTISRKDLRNRINGSFHEKKETCDLGTILPHELGGNDMTVPTCEEFHRPHHVPQVNMQRVPKEEHWSDPFPMTSSGTVVDLQWWT